MTKLQVIELLKIIKRTYPLFDVSMESIEHHAKYLHDFPFAAASDNIDRWIKTERFAPTIADIRGRVGDQIESQRSKDETDSFFAQVELWSRNGNPPPDGYWEGVKLKLQGGGT